MMRVPSITLLPLALIATSAVAQMPLPVSCSGDSCTFTLSFDDNNGNAPWFVAGAPYSGQLSVESANTMGNGAHTSVTTLQPMTYQDSKGRLRTERPAYGSRATGRPAPLDDFTVVEIKDPVARYQYILDPVNHIAHRMPMASTNIHQWSARSQPMASSTTNPDGSTTTVEPLGTMEISGVTAYGIRTTRAYPPGSPNGAAFAGPVETWQDPKNGAILLNKNTRPQNTVTMTMLHYSAGEPDPALFRVPDGYQVVDETGNFNVVHTRNVAAGGRGGVSSSGGGMQGEYLEADCSDQTCTITYNPATPPQPMRAVSGAAYAGRLTNTSSGRVAPDGSTAPPFTSLGRATWRDIKGRVRTETLSFRSGPRAFHSEGFGAEIEDPVAGYRYILDSVNKTAYRLPMQATTMDFRPMLGGMMGGGGPNSTNEDLGSKTLFGVTAVGRRTTQVQPVGGPNNNDRPLTNISERWTDPQTGIMILSKNSGPNGENSQSMPDYKAGEPDPAVFQVPADYKIVDEAGKFTFTIPFPK